MTSTKNNPINDKTKTPRPLAPKQTPTPHLSFQASEKVQAVLAVWTERCKPVDVCREMRINWTTFQQWQQRAMEGMLQALESRVNLSRGEVLSPGLQVLLHKPALHRHKLQKRLQQIQLA